MMNPQISQRSSSLGRSGSNSGSNNSSSNSSRRSPRHRRQVQTIYDEAAQRQREDDEVQQGVQALILSRRKRRSAGGGDEDESRNIEKENRVETEPDEPDNNESEEEGSDEDEDEEDEKVTPKQKRRSTAQSPRSKPLSRKILLDDCNENELAASSSHWISQACAWNNGSGISSRAPANRRTVAGALVALARRVLDPSETEDRALVAALLHSYKPAPVATAATITNKKERRFGHHISMYTEQLQLIARRVLEQHTEDPNRAEVSLFNLMFRSVGGSYETMLDHEEVNLEDLLNDDWGTMIKTILDGMGNTPVESVLLCADPMGAVHESSKGAKSNIGAVEYRKIYEEFWYHMSAVALAGAFAAPQAHDSGSALSDGTDDAATTALRFSVELVRDIMTRMIEMTGVGIGDIRSAATIAVYHMAIAMLERTVELKAKLEVVQRLLAVAKKNRMVRKAEFLKSQRDSWKRSTDDLEEIVNGAVMSVFVKRYRDVNKYIRADSLKAMSMFSIIRPDIFLSGTYLKYLGWMLSDKEATVRISAFKGLLAPFRESELQVKSGKPATIDTSSMSAVLAKFLPRIADCVLDVDITVQEVAMDLLLTLLREALLDDLDVKDEVWEQINMRALAPDTSQNVRRMALYFVIEQLEAFDGAVARKLQGNEVERISELATWVAHALSDAEGLPVDQVFYDLVDLVVVSLRSMPEHSSLIRNWMAMLAALGDCNKITDCSENRSEAVKQRVVLQMLICGAEMEGMDGMHDAKIACIGQDRLAFEVAEKKRAMVPRTIAKKKAWAESNEELTLALLHSLPELLQAFKTDPAVVARLASLPQCFVPSVFNLASRKSEFQLLVANLSESFLNCPDTTVLENSCMTLSLLQHGDHARVGDVLLQLKNIAYTLRDRFVYLLEEKSRLKSLGNSCSDRTTQVENEIAICLCVRRMSILSQQCYIGELLADPSSEQFDPEIDSLFKSVSENAAKDLKARMISTESGESGGDIWSTADTELHGHVASTITESLTFLLATAAWRLSVEIERADAETVEYPDNLVGHIVVRMRDTIAFLLHLCFDLFIDESSDDMSPEQVDFAEAVNWAACDISPDLRSLFPVEWKKCKSPFLVACALEDKHLKGGHMQVFRHHLENHDLQDDEFHQLLLSVARAVAANWKYGNRAECGMALSAVVGRSHDAGRIITTMLKALRKIDQFRVLEAHMFCLQREYDGWMQLEPGELESDRPSEEEITAYEEAVAEHGKQFDIMVQKAQRLSSSLGVGKLNKDLLEKLVRFINEGIRFAFSTHDPESEEDFSIDARLRFLLVLRKYLVWIRRDKPARKQILQFLNNKEAELRNSPEFVEVVDEDKEALKQFRKEGDLGEFVVEDQNTRTKGAHADSRLLVSRALAKRSLLSSMQSRSALSPVIESDPDVGNSPNDSLADGEENESDNSTWGSPVVIRAQR